MSDYRVFNDNGEERSWEELYEDNVALSKEIDMWNTKYNEVYDENEKLKEEFLKLEDKYIHNVPCCNEEDCDFYKKYKENETDLTLVYLKGYEDGKEKYNHYKLLYQKVKERNMEAIKLIENDLSLGISTFGSIYSIGANKVLDILKGNNETQ